MSDPIERYGYLLARVLACAIFLDSAFGKAAHFTGTAGFMATRGLPVPALLLTVAILVETAGGLSLLLGFRTRWGALLLFLFLSPTTALFHNFWALSGAEAQDMKIHFLKNVAIMGGLLALAAHGPGPLSLDALTRKR